MSLCHLMNLCCFLFLLFLFGDADATNWYQRSGKLGRYNRVVEYEKCLYGICMDTDDYPINQITRLMKSNDHVKLFGLILNSTYDSNLLKNRWRLNTQSSPLCRVRPASFTPRVMINKEGSWKYIVNVQGFQQIFSAEMCVSDILTGKEEEDLCHETFDFACKQEYQDMFFLVYEDGRIDFDKFFVPTTCSCTCAK